MRVLIISAIFLIASFFGWFKEFLPFDIAWVTIILCGYPILKDAICGLLDGFNIKTGVLVSIALIASIAVGEYFAAAEVAFIMVLGEFLEELTVDKAKAGIERLISLAPQRACLKTQEGLKEIAVEDVKINDILLIKPGEKIPVDGIITKGNSAVDESIMTGESIAPDKKEGDFVYGGTLNQNGVLEVIATKIGEDSTLGRMIQMVKDSENKKAKIVTTADKWATILVFAALIAGIATFIVTNDPIRTVTVLIVFCPCSLVLATPTAIIAAIGSAAKYGILIKSGQALEMLAWVKAFAFDKTGTITQGKPELVGIMAFDEAFNKQKLLYLGGIAEKFSEHPLGKTIYERAEKENPNLPDSKNFVMHTGLGVSADIEAENVLLGNIELLNKNGITVSEEIEKTIIEEQLKGQTVIIMAINNDVKGLFLVSDIVKEYSKKTIEALKQQGAKKIIMLTGDSENAAKNIANQVNITEVKAKLLPHEKVNAIIELKNAGYKTAMVGDGINDAPALAEASVGIAMASRGSDLAIEAADITIIGDDISKLPRLYNLSHRTLSTIKFNILLSVSLNFAGVILAMLGMIGPLAGALLHNCGSILVVLNSVRLLSAKRQ